MKCAIGMAAMAALCLPASSALADAPCDGVYSSWGRACYGSAHVRSKTIEWHAPFSSCSASPYEVIDSDLEADMPRVAYKFLKRSKGCQYEVMPRRADAVATLQPAVRHPKPLGRAPVICSEDARNAMRA